MESLDLYQVLLLICVNTLSGPLGVHSKGPAAYTARSTGAPSFIQEGFLEPPLRAKPSASV